MDEPPEELRVEEDEEERRGYDNYRYASGRFAPKGRGTRRGYVMPEYPAGYPMYPPVVYDRMGYTGGDSSSSSSSFIAFTMDI